VTASGRFACGLRLLGAVLASLFVLCGPATAGEAQTRTGGDGRPPVGAAWPPLAARTAASKDGTNIAYWVGGRGRTTLVFIHGWSCNHRFFGPQFAAVAPDYRILAVDLAGHGASGLRSGAVTVEAFADDVEAVVRREARGPVILVVHSTGGRVAAAVTSRLGDQLIGVIGVDTFQNLGMPPPREELATARLAAQRADFVGDTRRYVASFFQPGADPELVAWVGRQMTATNPQAAIAANEAFFRFDAKAAITGWPRPVIAINSDWVPTDYRAIRQFVPGFDLVVLAGRGHFPQLDDPDSFNPILLANIHRIESTAGLGPQGH